MKTFLFILLLLPCICDAQPGMTNYRVSTIGDTANGRGNELATKYAVYDIAAIVVRAFQDSIDNLALKVLPSNAANRTQLVRTNASNMTLDYGNNYIFTGNTGTFTLPALSASIMGQQNAITVKNDGTGGSLTVRTNGNLLTIIGPPASASIVIGQGEAYTFMPTGTNFTIQ